MSKNVKVQFGPGNSMNIQFEDNVTAGQIARDPRVRAGLRSPENPRILLDGVEIEESTPLDDLDHIQLEQRATVKGSSL